MQYAIVEIRGHQYKVTPESLLEVDFLGDVKSLDCDKVLLIADGDKLNIGEPYLKDKLTFEVLGTKQNKIRVAKYHAKANTRKVTGSKRKTSVIKLSVKR
jgi:large subunit ribosomal protein L21